MGSLSASRTIVAIAPERKEEKDASMVITFATKRIASNRSLTVTAGTQLD